MSKTRYDENDQFGCSVALAKEHSGRRIRVFYDLGYPVPPDVHRVELTRHGITLHYWLSVEECWIQFNYCYAA
jgi:hypothetical protein